MIRKLNSGHADPTITLRHYQQSIPATVKAAAAAFEADLFRTGLEQDRVASEVHKSLISNGAGGRDRTGDLLITSQMLYQLSYTSLEGSGRGSKSPQPRPSQLYPSRRGKDHPHDEAASAIKLPAQLQVGVPALVRRE